MQGQKGVVAVIYISVINGDFNFRFYLDLTLMQITVSRETSPQHVHGQGCTFLHLCAIKAQPRAE